MKMRVKFMELRVQDSYEQKRLLTVFNREWFIAV